MPTVLLYSTPEIDTKLIDGVLKVLSAGGPLTWKKGRAFSPKAKNEWIQSLPKKHSGISYSLDRMIGLAQAVREIGKIKKDDFVVLFTSIRNSANWFSATKEKNIFISTLDWEYFTKKDPVYSMAYQVVENVFQSLSGIYYDNAEGHPNVHFDSIGCINDMCGHKTEIMLKMQTAVICESCMNYARKIDVAPRLINQIRSQMEVIRKHFITPIENIEAEPIHVKKNGKIWVGDTDLKLTATQSLLMTFFLSFPQDEGLSVSQFNRHQKKLEKIRRQIPRVREDTVARFTNRFDRSSENVLRSTICQLNGNINEKLGNELARNYLIQNIDGIYTIRLPQELRFIDLEIDT